uniref:Alkyl transferase n=1 Tax=Davidia involucrata TaxID=16924 RepID=A0A5B7BHP9_DAVIN
MEKSGGSSSVVENIGSLMRKCIYSVLSVGPIPNHIAFIMDGNRRYSKKWNMGEGAGHNVGFLALMSMLGYCYEWGIKYVTVYAFSIDNFKRRPEEVQPLMDLMQEKIEGLMKEHSLVNRYGVRVHFAGNLELLSEPVREAAKKAMAATASHSKAVLSICVAYTSTDEIVNAVQQSCKEKFDKTRDQYYQIHGSIKVVDVEKHMYMALAPDPDILVRTSGETRLSNFLLWQSAYSYIYSPTVLWPEIGFGHLVWAVLNFQWNNSYLEKKKKQH